VLALRRDTHSSTPTVPEGTVVVQRGSGKLAPVRRARRNQHFRKEAATGPSKLLPGAAHASRPVPRDAHQDSWGSEIDGRDAPAYFPRAFIASRWRRVGANRLHAESGRSSTRTNRVIYPATRTAPTKFVDERHVPWPFSIRT